MSEPLPLPIQSLTVRNFHCLRDVTIDFAPLTVLVGPNGSGKTTLLHALELLGDITEEKRSQPAILGGNGRIDTHTFDKRGGVIELHAAGILVGGRYGYRIDYSSRDDGAEHERVELPGVVYLRAPGQTATVTVPEGESVPWAHGGRSLLHTEALRRISWGGNGGAPALVPQIKFIESLRNLFVELKRYQLQPRDLREQLTKNEKRVEGDAMTPTGIGLQDEISRLLLSDRERLEQIENELAGWFPGFRRLAVEKGSIVVDYANGLRVAADAASDGLMLALGLLVITLGTPGRRVVLLEEPENGVHPGLLVKLVGFLKSLTVATLERPATQIILTTHSPLLLNEVAPESIRLVRREPGRGTEVIPFTNAPDLQRLLEFQGPGEIWINLREEYIAGGAVK